MGEAGIAVAGKYRHVWPNFASLALGRPQISTLKDVAAVSAWSRLTMHDIHSEAFHAP